MTGTDKTQRIIEDIYAKAVMDTVAQNITDDKAIVREFRYQLQQHSRTSELDAFGKSEAVKAFGKLPSEDLLGTYRMWKQALEEVKRKDTH